MCMDKLIYFRGVGTDYGLHGQDSLFCHLVSPEKEANASENGDTKLQLR